jgi:adenine deaminase
MNEAETRRILSEVALGNISPDTVITNGTLFNVFTREFTANQSIWIKDGRIAYVGPDHDPEKTETTHIIEANEMVLLPGLIDGHTHLSTSRSGVEEFVKHVIPTGTTTVVTETTELASVVGRDGLEYWVRGFDGQPIRIYYTVPPLCGLTLTEEIVALTKEELLPYLREPNCVGLGELYWSNIFIEGRQGERVKELAAVALDLGKRVEGHTAGASGRKLQAYSCFGISSCHEPITEDEVMERLRLGYWMMIREGSIRKELRRVKGVFQREIDSRRLILSTDGMDPIDITEKGYLDVSLRTMLGLGVPPAIAYQMVTINVAEHFRLDDVLGSLSPGRMADVVIIPSPEEFTPQLVMCNGKIISRDGRTMAEPRKVVFPDYMFDTVKVKNFTLPPIRQHGKVRVMELVSSLVTMEKIIDLDDPAESKDAIMALALERLGHGGSFLGFLKGFGLQRGAYGSTMCWDTCDMVVLGCDISSMATVIGRLKEIGGGGVYAIGGEVIAEFPASLCGVLSLKPMEILREEMKGIEGALQRNGTKWEKPMLTVDTLTTAAIPHLRISHNGYVRLKDRTVLSCNV